jgi:uncharacterized protein
VSSSPASRCHVVLPGEELAFHQDEDDIHEDAVWKSSYVNALPDSAFLYIEPGGTKDEHGRTDGAHRHFPYRDDTGAIDLVHVRDAIGRIPQSNVPPAVKAKIQEKARKILAAHGGHPKMDETEVSRDDVVRFDASKFKTTPQGGLRGPAAVSRVGVFMYRHDTGPMAGKIVREFRPADEVFHPDSLATLDQAPITEGHPGLLNRDNTTKFSKGQLTDVHHDETHVLTDAVIQDGKTVDGVLSGKLRDFSPGYVCKMDWTPGTWNGQAYDVVQRGIKYNHVAILPPNRGRQGSTVALRFDAAILTETPMIVHFDGKNYDLADEAQRAAYHAALNAKTQAEKTRADQAEARADALEAELKPLKEAKAQEARAALEASALKVRPELKDVKLDGLSDREVREKAIGVDCTGKSDEYVAARFDQLLETPPAAPATDTALENVRGALEPVIKATQTNAVPPSWTTRWQNPLTASKDKSK